MVLEGQTTWYLGAFSKKRIALMWEGWIRVYGKKLLLSFWNSTTRLGVYKYKSFVTK